MTRRLTLALMAGAAIGTVAQADLPCEPCTFEKVAQCGGFLEGPVFDASGELLVVDFFGGAIFAILDGRCHEIANTEGQANGARLSPTGELFIADARRGILRRMPDGGNLVPHVHDVPANDLVFDASGGFYFTSPDGSDRRDARGKLYYVAPDSAREPAVIRDDLPFPNGVTLSPDGNEVYVGLFADKSIVALPAVASQDPVKIEYLLLRTEGGVGPDGMIVDAGKRLIWANFGDRSLGVARNGRIVATLYLPSEAGPLVTNVTEHEGYLYVTEASKGEVWRVRWPAVRGN